MSLTLPNATASADGGADAIRPFRIEIPGAALDDLRRRDGFRSLR